MDSLDGIVEWWLPRHYIRIGVERVARALDTLTQRGLVERVTDSNQVLYRLRNSGSQRGAPSSA
jgi:Fe2+ or Zn2+ uptake regulation protein